MGTLVGDVMRGDVVCEEFDVPVYLQVAFVEARLMPWHFLAYYIQISAGVLPAIQCSELEVLFYARSSYLYRCFLCDISKPECLYRR